MGYDIKPERQLIKINFANKWFLLNAVRAIETGWVMQLNGDATFGFCCANIDIIALGFCSFGVSNNPVCFSYIQHQTEGEKLYTKTYYEIQSAVVSLLKANTEKDCESSPHLLSRCSKTDQMLSCTWKVRLLRKTSFWSIRLKVTSFQADLASRTRCLAFHQIPFFYFRTWSDFFLEQVLPPPGITMCIMSKESMPASSTIRFTSRLSE